MVYDKKHNCVREKINNQIINSVRTTVKKTPIYDAVLPIAHLLKEKKRGLSNSNKVLLVQTNKFVKETEFYNTNKSSIIIPDSNLNYDICSYAESVIDMKMIDSITIKSLNRSRK